MSKCEAIHPEAKTGEAYCRCIHTAGHIGRHEDTYGRWWGKIERRRLDKPEASV